MAQRGTTVVISSTTSAPTCRRCPTQPFSAKPTVVAHRLATRPSHLHRYPLDRRAERRNAGQPDLAAQEAGQHLVDVRAVRASRRRVGEAQPNRRQGGIRARWGGERSQDFQQRAPFTRILGAGHATGFGVHHGELPIAQQPAGADVAVGQGLAGHRLDRISVHGSDGADRSAGRRTQNTTRLRAPTPDSISAKAASMPSRPIRLVIRAPRSSVPARACSSRNGMSRSGSMEP